LGSLLLLPCIILGHTNTSKGRKQPLPIYLFAGQSNMQGNVDSKLMNTLVKVLKSPIANPQQPLEEAINNWYHNYSNGYALYGWSQDVTAVEVENLILQRQVNLISNAFPKIEGAFCTSDGSAAQPLGANCGNPFGPELMAGAVLAQSRKRQTPVVIVKVVKGGTTLAVDWISPSSGQATGPMYSQLADRIASLKTRPESVHPSCRAKVGCRFHALVWFQGENDCFNKRYASSYLQNLEYFVSDVRAAVQNPTLPIIIVQLGYWANLLKFGPTVLAAQRIFVANDSNAKLVETNDLSRFFHCDPAAQCVIGERVGRVLVTL